MSGDTFLLVVTVAVLFWTAGYMRADFKHFSRQYDALVEARRVVDEPIPYMPVQSEWNNVRTFPKAVPNEEPW